MPLKPVYDRALLLLGPKRNKVLTLEEVRQYGVDSFSDPDYVTIYGMVPAAWYRQGIRLLGRTAVECTRGRIGKDIASIVVRLPQTGHFTVIDPFAGSCNMLYWILRHVPDSQGISLRVRPPGLRIDEAQYRGLGQNDRPTTWRLPIVSHRVPPVV